MHDRADDGGANRGAPGQRHAAEETQAAGKRTAALVNALGRLGIQDWQGVGNAEGEPVSLTSEVIDALPRGS